MAAFEWKGYLQILDETTMVDSIINDDDVEVIFDPKAALLSAITSGKTISGKVRNSAPDPNRDPMTLSCDLDDGTPTLWSLFGMTPAERKALADAYMEGLL